MQMPTVNARCAAMIDEAWHPYWWINAIGAPVSVSAADVQCVGSAGVHRGNRTRDGALGDQP